MKKYKYKIMNLDCANCAKNLENELNKKLNNVIVNFSQSTISYESDKELSLNNLNKLVREIEPEAEVIDINEERKTKEYNIYTLLIGIIIGIIGIYIKKDILIIISYIILLYKPCSKAIKILIKSRLLNENALITISCIGAYLVNQKMEGIMVVSLYLLGKILEEKALNNTRKEVKNLINIRQEYANKKEKNEIIKINVEEVKVNDILVVKKGEKIPVDGIVIKGCTKLNTESITGESELRSVNTNEIVLSGCINTEDIIEIKATTTYNNSTIAKIIELISEATDKKSKTETKVSNIAKIYTPAVLILAILVVILLPIIFNISFNESLYRGLTFLVIACPCAIAISVPLSYFTGIGVTSKKGILIKGSNYLDNLSKINKIIFDKTGTLTNGTFEITKIDIIDKKYNKDELIKLIIKGESLSNHPIAKSFLKLSNKKIDNSDVLDFKEIPGKGISYKIKDKEIKIGTIKNCINCNADADIHVNINNKHVASVTINDGIKGNSKECIEYLNTNNIETYMFTGDSKEISNEIAQRIGIKNVMSEMLPTDKYNEYEKIKKDSDVIAFVGDGVNDAPILKRADIGISMGSIGQEIAIESSDIVIANDEIIKIRDAIEISKYTNKVIKENLIFALATKAIILILSIFGLSTMWFAVFADTGVTLLTILNTLKILKK
ncbi:MAG: cadmium-translocating P-type ATPase [Bacilli bacterium]|nr:cadmium-translocating P-type ATPase [Bacilli bacterium]